MKKQITSGLTQHASIIAGTFWEWASLRPGDYTRNGRRMEVTLEKKNENVLATRARR